MARIVGHLPVEEPEARYRAARDATEARHFQAIWLLAQGRTVLEVSEVLAFVPRWVEELARRYNAFGPEALGDQRRRHGLAEVHAQRGWEALKRIGWSLQAPRPRHARAATPEQRAAFKGGSRRRWRGPGRRIPTAPSRPGRPTSTASA